MLDDVPAIVRAACVPPERTVLFGRSVGSLFALDGVARFPGVAGLVFESAIADPLERILLRVRPDELDASPEAFAAAVAARLDLEKKLAAYRGAGTCSSTISSPSRTRSGSRRGRAGRCRSGSSTAGTTTPS